MSLKYTQVPSDTFQHLVLNAGILAAEFNPATGVVGSLLGATSGGIAFATNPTFTDFGEDIDNIPANTKQLKRITAYDPSVAGTFLTVTPAVIAALIGAADVDGTDATKIVPREQLVDADFDDVWLIGDYSDVNTGANAGFLAIHLRNALNTAGFQIQTGKDAKGTMSFEYHAHYDLTHMELAPFEIYCKAGTGGAADPFVTLDNHVIRLAVDETFTLNAAVSPAGTTVTWSSASTTYATVSGGVVTGKAAGSTIITASITSGGVTYTDTCTVIVAAAGTD